MNDGQMLGRVHGDAVMFCHIVMQEEIGDTFWGCTAPHGEGIVTKIALFGKLDAASVTSNPDEIRGVMEISQQEVAIGKDISCGAAIKKQPH